MSKPIVINTTITDLNNDITDLNNTNHETELTIQSMEDTLTEDPLTEIDLNNIPNLEIAFSDDSVSEGEYKIIRKDQDRQQMIQVYVLFLIEIFKVAMASFLSMSVIQNCGGEVCGYSQNVHRNSSFGQFVVGINALNICAFGILYFYEFNREMFLINYLDIDKLMGDYHLPYELSAYPDITHQLKRYNRIYYVCTRILLGLTSLNWILSGILVFNKFYSIKTITSYLTNILLVITKLSDSYRISRDSSKHNYGLSAYIKEYTSFNVIDKDHVHE